MFAPKVAKVKTDAAKSPTGKLAPQRIDRCRANMGRPPVGAAGFEAGIPRVRRRS